MEAFIGTILPVGFNYAPRGWAFCNGQLLPISQYSALFALLGTMYGGNGQTTFGLPDLRGRVIVGSQGNGPGLQPVAQGEMAGTNNSTVIANGQTSFTLTSNNLPAHTHAATTTLNLGVAAGAATTVSAANNNICSSPGGPVAAQIFGPAPAGGVVAAGGVGTQIGNTGGGAAVVAPVTTQATVGNMQPYLGLNYIIALEGIFPSRN